MEKKPICPGCFQEVKPNDMGAYTKSGLRFHHTNCERQFSQRVNDQFKAALLELRCGERRAS